MPFLGDGRFLLAQQLLLCQMGFMLARLGGVFEGIVDRDIVEELVEQYTFSRLSRIEVKVGLVDSGKVRQWSWRRCEFRFLLRCGRSIAVSIAHLLLLFQLLHEH